MRTLAAVAWLCLFSVSAADDEFKELFNGRDLAGWDGDERIWSVEDGLLTGQTRDAKDLQHNTFAIWQAGDEDGEVGDFELRAVFRLEGDNNSGVQYRSRRFPERGQWGVVGYQADIHPDPKYAGMLYDEGGRGIAAERGQKVILNPGDEKVVEPLPEEGKPYDLSEFNTLEVVAKGNRLIHKLNGQVTVDVTDNDPQNADARGIVALQVHAGPPMKVQYKSIKLKRL